MNECAFEVPFRVHDRDGRVRVRYEANQDPAHWGYDRLGFVTPPADMATGFPVLEAAVEYEAAGYFRNMGWIQIIQASYNNELARPDLMCHRICEALGTHLCRGALAPVSSTHLEQPRGPLPGVLIRS